MVIVLRTIYFGMFFWIKQTQMDFVNYHFIQMKENFIHPKFLWKLQLCKLQNIVTQASMPHSLIALYKNTHNMYACYILSRRPDRFLASFSLWYCRPIRFHCEEFNGPFNFSHFRSYDAQPPKLRGPRGLFGCSAFDRVVSDEFCDLNFDRLSVFNWCD